jgi:hypothetical protein
VKKKDECGMDNPNTLATMCTQNTEQINSKPKGHSRMENPETLATLGTQDTGRKQLNVRENRRGFQEWRIQILQLCDFEH